MNKDTEDKIRKNSRALQRAAAQMDKAICEKDQKIINRLLAERKEERRMALFLNLKQPDADNVIKFGTPEEKARVILSDYEREKKGEKPLLTLKQKRALHFDYEKKEERIFFLNYLKLYTDLADYANLLIPVYKSYQIEVALLSKLLDKYDAIQKDFVLYRILYNSLVNGKGDSDIKYNLYDNDLTKMKRLAENTPEALLAEFNDRYKDDGVCFSIDSDDRLVLSSGGLYNRIREQADKCTLNLSYVKAYIEPVEEYLKENEYNEYAPSKLLDVIHDTKDERFSRSIIAPEFHESQIFCKQLKGEDVSEHEMMYAVVPNYIEVEPSKEVKDSCINYIKEHRNEQLPYEY